MMKRILKRPMFKMGGDVENVGIMDGMRNRYQDPTDAPVGSPRDERLQSKLKMINALTPGPNLNQFLIDFGLNLASGPPRGNILSTAATAARDPFQRFMAGQQTADKTRAALAIDALTDDDRVAAEKTAELMSKTEGNEFFGKYNEALNFVLSKAAQDASPFRKKVDPEVTAIDTAKEEYRMGDIAAKQAAPYIQNITKIVAALDKLELPLDEKNPFRFSGRKKYENGAVYIDARTNKIVRYDKGANSFTDISDQVDLSEIM
tara:strand:+ start:72 stop:857 length:786 start_codon:yes stop_codon:yes gene_type:complete